MPRMWRVHGPDAARHALSSPGQLRARRGRRAPRRRRRHARLGFSGVSPCPRLVSAQIVVFLENRPGALAELCDVLSGAKVNIEAMLLEGSVDFGNVRLHVNAPRKAERALREADYQFRIAEAIALTLSNEPGALADAAKKLSKAKVNIEALFGTTTPGTEEAEFVLMVSDVEKARKALGLDKQA